MRIHELSNSKSNAISSRPSAFNNVENYAGFGGVLIQVVDTPGLLVRPDPQRKPMELLTLAVLEHTASVCEMSRAFFFIYFLS
jgi:hypothetical protein